MRFRALFGLAGLLGGCRSEPPTPPAPASPPPTATATVSAGSSAGHDVTPDAASFADASQPPSGRDARIRATFGDRCRFERACGELWGIDCDAAVDGPYYYVRAGSLEVVSRCGGFCMGGRCTHCPPAAWTCPTY